jgi:hypothetical protein
MKEPRRLHQNDMRKIKKHACREHVLHENRKMHVPIDNDNDLLWENFGGIASQDWTRTWK